MRSGVRHLLLLFYTTYQRICVNKLVRTKTNKYMIKLYQCTIFCRYNNGENVSTVRVELNCKVLRVGGSINTRCFTKLSILLILDSISAQLYFVYVCMCQIGQVRSPLLDIIIYETVQLKNLF